MKTETRRGVSQEAWGRGAGPSPHPSPPLAGVSPLPRTQLGPYLQPSGPRWTPPQKEAVLPGPEGTGEERELPRDPKWGGAGAPRVLKPACCIMGNPASISMKAGHEARTPPSASPQRHPCDISQSKGTRKLVETWESEQSAASLLADGTMVNLGQLSIHDRARPWKGSVRGWGA